MPNGFNIKEIWISISNEPNDWALFGNFISPIFSLMSIIAILFTIYNSNKKIEEGRRQDQKRDVIRYKIKKLDELLSLVYECYESMLKAITLKWELEIVDALAGKTNKEIVIEKQNLFREMDTISSPLIIKIEKLKALSSLHFNCINGIHIFYLTDCWDDIIKHIVNSSKKYSEEYRNGNDYIKDELRRYIKKIKDSPEADDISEDEIESGISIDILTAFHNKTKQKLL